MKEILSALAVASSFGCATIAGAETDAAFVLPSGVEVSIVESVFQKENFKVEGCTAPESGCRINGHVPFGTESSLPKTYVKSISIKFQQKTYVLDASDMYNAWGARPLEYKGAIRYFGGNCFDAYNCQVRGIFSDAAGSFVAEWRVVNGLPVRTVLTGSGDVMDLFRNNIDPPSFE